jgi:hypothetical protein
MAFQSLSTALNGKPQVLAGPLLRKVTPEAATVWLALRTPCDVALTVFIEGSGRLMEGHRHTVAIGTNLHIAAVKATLKPPAAELIEGVIYSYDLTFDFDDGSSQTLAAATDNAELHYPPFAGPTFCLPPRDANHLRLLHGSCRMPHGDGPDALALLDNLIAQAASNPIARPHQLLLTGDQIYADDVSYSLSMLLSDASEALLGWSEEIVSGLLPTPGSTLRVTDLYPGLRREILVHDAGFTSEDLNCQLIGLGEFLAMYLFAWSEVLWPSGSSTIPTFAEIDGYFGDRFSALASAEEVAAGRGPLDGADRQGIDGQTRRLQQFRDPLTKVRKALANIPTYMIFDDHEVTDDWNMTRRMCQRVYGSELGRRTFQNALVAYSLCQHWGNAPDQFEADPPTPGFRLLQMLDNGNADNYDANSGDIRAVVAVQDEAALASVADGGLFHDDLSAFTYNYTVEGPAHQIIVTDTRTWRSFPRGVHGAPDLLPSAQVQQQIGKTEPTGDRILLVVVTTNAPAIPPVRAATRHSTVVNAVEHFPDIYDSWELPADATDRLFKAISDKLPVIGGERRGRAVILSGDVHMSFATRLLFTATSRFEDPVGSPQPVRAVLAQLVASSFKKQDGDTEGFHREGYLYAPRKGKAAAAVLGIVIRGGPEGYVGWNRPPGTRLVVGSQVYFAGMATTGGPKEVRAPKTEALSVDNVLLTSLTVPPDYRYRLDYLTANNEGVLPAPLPIPAVPSDTTEAGRKEAAKAFHAATGNYRRYNAGGAATRQVVGLNNLAELTFEWGPGDNKRINHSLRWEDPGSGAVQFTTYTVSLDPDDPQFPEIEPG